MNPIAGIVKCTQVIDRSYAQKRDAAGMGFYHRHDFSKERRAQAGAHKSPAYPDVDWDRIVEAAGNAPRHLLYDLASQFECEPEELNRWGVGYLSRKFLWKKTYTKCAKKGAWTFPMRDHTGSVIGIRLRTSNGGKFAVRGSQNGLFFAPPLTPNAPLLVVDGASDAFCGWRAQLNIVGRPSSTSGDRMLIALANRLQSTEVHQLLDRDPPEEPIYHFTRDTARNLMDRFSRGTIFYPPHPYKDLRQWLQQTNGSLPIKFSRLANTCGTTA